MGIIVEFVADPILYLDGKQVPREDSKDVKFVKPVLRLKMYVKLVS